MKFSHGSSNARGVAVFFNKSIDFQIDDTYGDDDGRILMIVLTLNNRKVCISNLYAPNITSNTKDRLEHESFFKQVLNKLNDIKSKH